MVTRSGPTAGSAIQGAKSAVRFREGRSECAAVRNGGRHSDSSGDATKHRRPSDERSKSGNRGSPYRRYAATLADSPKQPTQAKVGLEWATRRALTYGSASQSGMAVPLCPCMEQSIQGNAPETLTSPQIELPQSSTSQLMVAPETSGSYVLLVGDQGINGPGCPQDPTHCHNVGSRFNLAATSEASILAASGASSVVTIRVSSVQDFNSGLTTSGSITGGVTYFGHGAEGQLPDKSWLSLLAVGQGQGVDTNVSALNVNTLSNAQLGNNAAITLKTCRAGSKSSSGGPSIAQLLANQLNRGVYAWKVGAFFSQNPNATIPNGMPPQTSPMYLLPLGGSGVAPCAFIPNQPEPQRCGGEK